MGTCQYCGRNGKTISGVIGFCAPCIRDHFEEIRPQIKSLHDRTRKAFQLPQDPPRNTGGLTCPLCMHGCQIPEGGTGFCGLRRVEDRHLRGGRPHEGNLSYYYDPLPTNCVASFVCPAGTGSGFPRYAVSKGPEYGYKNLAVFYHACSFNCLYCQNYHYKEQTALPSRLPAKKLAAAVDDTTTCICYFGGDPTPQILHALKASKIALSRKPGKILRICWETNGCVQEPYLSMMAELSLRSAGCIKFDLKGWNENIHYALCGVTNKKTLENFRKLSKIIPERPHPPFLIASTLLVPGYVDEEEVAPIARYIAGLNPEIPYSLLAFYPHFYLNDLPTTSRAHALRCKEIAERQGLHNVHIGNLHLLGEDYP
ncbi:MAG: radical SAM protein [Deltaproteobacteria bacterium]|nr:radical SAM protein [Deltaproteobacteria bacterium]MBW2046430.1 radical SAM protein [Deltaproteobacteria bacterium]MBW2301986.1 radical SAM protein [Deltaproteobacteria bacterium]